MNKDLKNIELSELEELCIKLGLQKYQAKNIFSWIHQKNCDSIDKISNLAKDVRSKLKTDGFFISNLKTVNKLEDPDGTIKYIFQLADEHKIETVLLKDKKGRITLCISSQVGCSYQCDFCATGRVKFKRNLTAAEIADQVIQIAKDGIQMNNLVYMGMGEPLVNYDNVISSVRILNNKHGKNIWARHITISTVGIIPGIRKLTEEPLQIRLAISLHAATDTLRNKLIPVNKKYPLADLIKAVKEYQYKTKRRVTFEYIILNEVNDSRENARSLMKTINRIKCNVNLIEFNDYSGSPYQASDRKKIKEFKWLLQDRGFEVNLRYKRGRDISAACGQLGSHHL